MLLPQLSDLVWNEETFVTDQEFPGGASNKWAFVVNVTTVKTKTLHQILVLTATSNVFRFLYDRGNIISCVLYLVTLGRTEPDIWWLIGEILTSQIKCGVIMRTTNSENISLLSNPA